MTAFFYSNNSFNLPQQPMLPAARVSDLIVSPATVGVPTPIIPPGAPMVLIGGLPAARMGDSCGADIIVKGSATVLIGGLPAARIADITASGGTVLPPGCPTVLIGG
jgi:uncharacterized Zn-binding protein involved in type VI secretion